MRLSRKTCPRDRESLRCFSHEHQEFIKKYLVGRRAERREKQMQGLICLYEAHHLAQLVIIV